MKIQNIRLVTCKGCKKPIFFVLYKGRYQPLDSTPRLVYIPKVCTRDSAGEIIHVEEWELVTGYESHYATCPAVDKFRR